MTKYKRKAAFRAPYIDVALSLKKRNGKERYQLNISNLDKEDFQEDRKPIEWKKIDIDGFYYIKYGSNRQNTAKHNQGETIYLLCSKDGGKIEIDPRTVRAYLGQGLYLIMKSLYAGKDASNFKPYCSSIHKPHLCKCGGKKGEF